jgi:hypothetical protein
MKKRILLAITVLALLMSGAVQAAAPGCDRAPKVEIINTKGSGLISFSLVNCRKIGHVVIEVKDETGRTLYREEGKAMTPELVRRLDKGAFPKGQHTLVITAKDFTVSQSLVID